MARYPTGHAFVTRVSAETDDVCKAWTQYVISDQVGKEEQSSVQTAAQPDGGDWLELG